MQERLCFTAELTTAMEDGPLPPQSSLAPLTGVSSCVCLLSGDTQVGGDGVRGWGRARLPGGQRCRSCKRDGICRSRRGIGHRSDCCGSVRGHPRTQAIRGWPRTDLCGRGVASSRLSLEKALSEGRFPVGLEPGASPRRRTGVIVWRVAFSEHHPAGSSISSPMRLA